MPVLFFVFLNLQVQYFLLLLIYVKKTDMTEANNTIFRIDIHLKVEVILFRKRVTYSQNQEDTIVSYC